MFRLLSMPSVLVLRRLRLARTFSVLDRCALVGEDSRCSCSPRTGLSGCAKGELQPCEGAADLRLDQQPICAVGSSAISPTIHK